MAIIFLISFAMLVGISYAAIFNIKKDFSEIVKYENPKVQIAYEMKINSNLAIQHVLNYINDTSILDKARFNIDSKQLIDNKTKYSQKIHDDFDLKQLHKLDSLIYSFNELGKYLIELSDKDDSNTFNNTIQEELAKLHQTHIKIDSILDYNILHRALDIIQKDEEHVSQVTNRLIVELLIVGIFILFSFLIVSRSISTPLNQLVTYTKEIGRGTFDVSIKFLKRKDEIGTLYSSFNKMVKNLNRVTASRDELDKEVQHRIATEVELKKAKYKAEESNRLKTVFLGNMSHELKTPLNHILGFSELISYQNELTKVKQYAELINKSADQLLSIIEDLFLLTQLDMNEIEINNELFSLNELIAEIEVVANEEIYEKGKANELTFGTFIKIDQGHLLICCDKPKILKISAYLIKNAIKFTQSGSIDVSAQVIEETLILSFKDSGIGISNDARENVFEMFRQADESLTRKFQGLGIGLTIAHKIVNLLKGEITLKTKEGIGSEFIINIPLVQYKLLKNSSIWKN